MRSLASLILALALVALPGCGQMGPLYIPVEEGQEPPVPPSDEQPSEANTP